MSATACHLGPLSCVSLSFSVGHEGRLFLFPYRIAVRFLVLLVLSQGGGNWGGRSHYDDLARNAYEVKREGGQHGDRMPGAALGCSR